MPIPSTRPFVTTLITVSVLLNLVVGYLLVRATLDHRDYREAEMRREAEGLARAMDQDISREVDRIDVGLRTLADALEQEREDAATGRRGRPVDALLERGGELLGGQIGFSVLDTEGGRQVAGPSSDEARARAPDGVEPHPTEERPLVTGPLADPRTGRPSIRLTRPYRGADGRNAGLVAAWLPVTTLSRTLARVAPGPRVSAEIRDSAGRLVARHPPSAPADPGADDAPEQDRARELMASGATTGTYLGHDPDGAERIHAYRRLDALPFHLVVAFAVADVPPLWRTEIVEHASIGALFLLLSLFSAQLMWSQFRRAEESRSLLRSLMNNIPDLVWLKDPNGVYLACNPRFEQFFGQRESDIVGRDDYHFMDRDLAEFFRTNDRLAVEADGPRLNEEWLTFATDGYHGLFETIKTPMKSAQGNLIGVLGIARDISRQHQAIASLRDERRFRETIMESIPGICYALDRDGTLLYWNRTLERTIECAPDRLDGAKVLDFFADDERQLIAERLASAFADAAPTTIEVEATLRTRQGAGTPFHFSSRRIDIGGQPLLVGVGIDISARRAAEDAWKHLNGELEERVRRRTNALQAAHARLQDTEFAMDSVGIGITWADFATGRFIHANRFSAEFLGYRLDELLQLRVCDIDPNFPPELYARMADGIRERGYAQFETAHLTKDGRLLPVEMTVYYHGGNEATAPRLIAFMSDIGRRKEAESALRRAKESSEAASAAKSEFLANMSHEIRTPLNAILGLNYLLKKEGASRTQRERLDKMEIAGRHLLSLINDILDLSKIEAGRMDLEHGNFHLSAVLDNVASIIRETASDKGLTLEVDADGVPLWLWGDVTRLRQALLNFAGNAVKFTEHGKVSLRSVLLREEGDDLLVRFEVEDTGIGLSPEQQERLFQAFEQADGSTARRFGGTGLGLALTKRLVELMGGGLGLESAVGVGSTFWFSVPLQRGHGPMPILPAAHLATGAGAESMLRARHRGARVLLAEDNAINIEVVLEMLHGVGIDVTVVENGREAVERARHQTFDLVLMDMQMPELGGIEATRLIRTLPQWAERPIIALTANAFSADRQACLAAGMNDMLTKPVEPDLLYAALLQWLAPTARGERDVSRLDPPSVPDQAEDGQLVQALRALPEVDVDTGLAMLRGNVRKYLGLVRQLVDSQTLQMLELEQVLDAGDQTSARRLAHSLKGAAATLGLTAIAETAFYVERLIGDAELAPAQRRSVAIAVGEIREALLTLEAILAPARRP